ESPSLRLIELLEHRGASTDYHDPHVGVIPKTREHAALTGRKSIPLTDANIGAYDVVLIATDHDAIDYKALVKASKLVVDTRNACAKAGITGGNVVKA
ncbi:MAG: UDP binding domain-containing protein, partial [Bosea sp. (in: a-proteobacteria)]